MSRRTWAALAALVAAAALLVACTDQPTGPTSSRAHRDEGTPSGALTPQLVRQLAAARGIVPLERPRPIRPALVQLGQALAFDKILSGNRDVACTTCHLPAYHTSDGRSLPIGSGGTGLGPLRTHPAGVLIPRNAPPFFNLFALRHLFWDGRVEVDASGHFHTPAGHELTPAMSHAFEFGAVSALGMFPVTSRIEMRGESGNELAAIPDADVGRIWAGLMRRLGAIPEYRVMFERAYPGTPFQSMNFAYASNAIGAFIVSQMSFTDTPWDRFLRGQDDALTPRQLAGAGTFLTLKCSQCHDGAMLSDDEFHDVAVPQIGPGEGNGASLHDDFGRMNVTGNPADLYRFRTSPLRNVELTAPYGHDGAYATLRAFIEHYSRSDQALLSYDPSQLVASLQGTVQPTASAILAHRDSLLAGVVLTPDVVDRLMDYMSALTDDAARDLSSTVPARVPSGLPVDRP